MNLAFITESDPSDIHNFSGTTVHMLAALRAAFEHVDAFAVTNFETLSGPHDQRLRQIGAEASAQLKHRNVDAVLCQGNSMIPYIDTHHPVGYWHDATWATLHQGHFPHTLDFEAFCKQHADLRDWDALALNRADLVIFAADWFVAQAIKHYNIPPTKLACVPFGANMTGAASEGEVESFLSQRTASHACLTWIGKHWQRKGLPRAVELAQRLNDAGLKTTLNIIGCQGEPPSIIHAPFVNYLGFLDKKVPANRELFRDVMQRTHFLVHPTRFECFGMGLTEANGFGIPVVATRVGGIGTVVHDDVNGRLFALETFVQEAAGYLARIFNDYSAAYPPLARGAYTEYRTRFNWETNARQVRTLIEDLVRRHRSTRMG